ncbi:MAG: rRNA maturation RNase YbeY [Myxococcota bacterium]
MSVAISGPPPDAEGARVDLGLLRRRTRALLGALGHARSELSLSLVDDPEIRRLNREWRKIDRATDVLSFSLLEGEHGRRRGRLLGDVVVSVETAARQARRAHRSLDETVIRLVIHGVLHVLGHDHVRPRETRAMRAEERRLWQELRG